MSDSSPSKAKRGRVAIIGARGVSNYGGFETFVAELAPRLTALNYEVLVGSRMGASPAGSAALGGVRIIYFPLRFPRGSGFGRLFEVLYDWYFVILCSFFLRCDIIYCLGITSGPVLPLARLAGSVTVLNLDGLEWRRPKFGLAEKSYIKLAFLTSYLFSDRLVIDNGQLLNFVPQVARPKCVMIPYGVSPAECPKWDLNMLEKRAPANASGLLQGRYWLVVARLEPDNLIHVIVEGYAKSQTALPLVVVGDFSSDKYRSRVTELIRTLGVADRTVMMGSVYEREALLMLRCHCAAYVHGHSVGGTNPSLLEAMGSENIILAHDNPFNREVCGSDAMFFADATELARELSSVASNRQEHVPAGERSRTRALEKYRWESVATSYDALFGAMLKSKLGR